MLELHTIFSKTVKCKNTKNIKLVSNCIKKLKDRDMSQYLLLCFGQLEANLDEESDAFPNYFQSSQLTTAWEL